MPNFEPRARIQRDGSSFNPAAPVERHIASSKARLVDKEQMTEREAKLYLDIEKALHQDMDFLADKLG